MALDEFIEVLKIDSSDLINSFKRAFIQGGGTPQEVADFRENHFQRFIRNYFPFPHRVTKGKIRDSYGNKSASVDCIIINPNHPYTIDFQEKFNLILADGVDVAIELKPDISTKVELERGLKQVQTVKKLRRRNGPIILKQTVPSEIVEYSRTIPSFIFSMNAKANIEDTFKDIKAFYSENLVPLEEQFDFIVINEVGIISNYKNTEVSIAFNKTTGEKLTGYFFEEWKDLTLGAFLLRLNSVYHASATVQKSILTYYLENIMPYSIRPL